MKNASSPGRIDLLKITVDDGTPTVQNVTLTTPVMAGVEKLELTANENVTLTRPTDATALNDVKFLDAGNVSVTTGAVDFGAITTFDFPAMKGQVTFNASSAQAGAQTGLLIKGSATTASDITGSEQGDVIVGAAGADVFRYTAAADLGDTINDFLSATDKVGVVTALVSRLAHLHLSSVQLIDPRAFGEL